MRQKALVSCGTQKGVHNLRAYGCDLRQKNFSNAFLHNVAL